MRLLQADRARSGSRHLAPGFQELVWNSRSLRARAALVLYLPPSYAEDHSRHFPSLYLLHGSGHDRHSVMAEVRPDEHLSSLSSCLLIIPDGDQGWWLDSPVQRHSQYETYVLELIAWVDRRYRTVTDRACRGVCGFSMGGYGAMMLAAHHPHLFGSASSLLGTLDIAQMFPHHYRLRYLLGAERGTWDSFSPPQHVECLANTRLRFSTAERATDLGQNESFARALKAHGISFEYRVYAGEHNATFVRQHIGEHLAFHQRVFDDGSTCS